MKNQPVTAISFDVNGTLIRAPRLGEIYSEVLQRHGLHFEHDPHYTPEGQLAVAGALRSALEARMRAD